MWPPNDSSGYCMTKLENSTNISLYFRQNNSLYVNVTQVPSVKNVVSSQISDHTYDSFILTGLCVRSEHTFSSEADQPYRLLFSLAHKTMVQSNLVFKLNILLKYNCCHINITNRYVFFQILRMFISLLYFFFYLVFSLLCYKNWPPVGQFPKQPLLHKG